LEGGIQEDGIFDPAASARWRNIFPEKSIGNAERGFRLGRKNYKAGFAPIGIEKNLSVWMPARIAQRDIAGWNADPAAAHAGQQTRNRFSSRTLLVQQRRISPRQTASHAAYDG
jgi:hypothetical protein